MLYASKSGERKPLGDISDASPDGNGHSRGASKNNDRKSAKQINKEAYLKAFADFRDDQRKVINKISSLN